jgi:8-oxo-dGTP pyrophosphatase MutT (NUDIX family)
MPDAKPAAVPAATVLLVRDAPDLHVLMVERRHEIDFASGALVFPGGKAHTDDLDPAWADFCDGVITGEPPEIQALKIAAIREAFEESGLLLARPMSARGVGAPMVEAGGFPETTARRAAIAAGAASFLQAVAADGLALALDALTPFAHWITPKGMPKRFDTHFYLAVAPHAQEALCDECETVEAVWLSPQEALAQGASGARKVMFPTRLNLELLAQAGDTTAAAAAARARPIVTVEPWVEKVDGVAMLRIRPDAGYGSIEEPLGPNS